MTGTFILGGDIGGTKTLLCLGSEQHGRFRVITSKRYESGAFADFAEVLTDFLASHPVSIASACFGVAGAVVEGICRATNLPWVLDEKELSSLMGGARVRLLNDLEAAAFGILHLPPEDVVDLNPGAVSHPGAHRAVIAAGTGLGEALIIQNGDTEMIVATEGGHCDFAPQNAQEDRLLVWMRESYPGHVSYERILSGPGLVSIYRFLVHDAGMVENAEVVAAMVQEDAAAVIGQWGVERRDNVCFDALRLFSRIYGAEAGNLVLKSFALQGLYVAGGIAPKILPVLRQGGFMEGFTAKGRFSHLLSEVPVRVVTNTDVVLLGAFQWAAESLRE